MAQVFGLVSSIKITVLKRMFQELLVFVPFEAEISKNDECRSLHQFEHSPGPVELCP
jgi:hypothetical protein